MSLDQVVSWLRCPVCERSFALDEASLGCELGHRFDIAKQGYVNLLGRAAPHNADTASMVQARHDFLSGGHYLPFAHEIAARTSGGRILEVGAGTGYYIAHVLARRGGIGLASDVSPAAAKRAARAHEHLASITADTWAKLPVRSSAIGTIICAFAPRNPLEFFRILSPGGLLIVLTPLPHHLAELRARYGLLDVGHDKDEKLAASMNGFEPIGMKRITFEMTLTRNDVRSLIAMGPNAFHKDATALVAADEPPVQVSAGASVTLFRKPNLS